MSDGRLGWMTVALALAIVPYAALMAFAHPVADDLAFAAAANVEGFWPALRIQYFSWNGRFASDVLALLDPIQTGSVLAYRLTLFAMLMVVIFYTVAAAWAWRNGRAAVTRTAFVMLAVALGASALVVGSPWNAMRETMYPAHRSLVGSVGNTLLQTVRFGVGWVTSGTLVLATILYLPFAERVAAAQAGLSRLGDRFGVALVALPFAAIPVSVFPAYWATGVLGQHRTVSVGFFAFLMLWFACVTAAIGSGGGGSSIPRRPGLKPAIAAALVAAIGFGGNGYTIAADFLYRRPQRFSAEMDARAAALDACRTASDRACGVSPSLNVPASIFFLVVCPDPTDWINGVYARFYGLRQVQASLSDDHVRH